MFRSLAVARHGCVHFVMFLRWRGFVVVLALGALIAAGCGSSSKSNPAPSASASTATPSATSTSAQSAISGNQLHSLPRVPAGSGPVPSSSSSASTVDESFLRTVFNDVQRVWSHEFKSAGLPYKPASLVFFSTNVTSPCGTQKKDEGAFYCGLNHTVYLDLSDLNQDARAGLGGFAQAYVVGHEFGHHVQNLLDIDSRAGSAKEANPKEKNALSVAEELQDDCLAGVWAHSAYRSGPQTASILEQKLEAANKVGDDYQARIAGQPVDPGLFTHGSSAQRQHWLKIGFESGRPWACDTFSGS